MILGLAPAITAMPFTSLMPIFAIDVFHGDAGTQGLLMMMTGIGGLTGALAIASMGRRQGNGKMMIGGVAGFGLSLLLFSQSPALSVAMLFTLLSGFFEVGYKSQNQTIIQMLVPEELRGRVLGIYMLDRGLQPVGSVLAGILAGRLNGPWAVAIMGMSCFVLAIGITLLVPGLWKANLVPAR